MKIDTHAHIFADFTPVAGARYVPEYKYDFKTYQELLRQNGFSHGVLVQPSFLGTDNSYALAAAKECDNLRIVAVLKPNEAHVLEQHSDLIAGVRLNLIGKKSPRASEYSELIKVLKSFDMHIELHQDLDELIPIAQDFAATGVRVVLDHLARPNLQNYLRLKELANCGEICFKISGFYRFANELAASEHEDFVRNVLELLLEYFPSENFVFGSDAPHTNYENATDFASVLKTFYKITPAHLQEQILGANAKRIFRF